MKNITYKKSTMTVRLAAVIFLTAACVFLPVQKSYAADTVIGVINYQKVMEQHPDMAGLSDAMKAAVEKARVEFEAKTATMTDQEKQAYYREVQQKLQAAQQDFINAVAAKVAAAIQAVADEKKITIVLDKGAVPYGGIDITDDVLKKINSK